MQIFRPYSETGLLKRAALLAFACFLTLPLADTASATPGDEGLGRARFSWDAVADPIVSGYKVYWGTESGVYTHTEDAGNLTERIVTGFSEGGEYFAAVTAYSDTGEESDYSTEISFTYDTSSLVITLTSQPQAQGVTVGETASFSVTATGSGTLTYQWQKDGAAIDGATSPTFSINSTLMTDAGSYSVVVANAAGTTTSDSAILSVTPATPLITATPVAASITYGQSLAAATLSGGSASVPGTFAFVSPFTAPNAGTAYHTVLFTPGDNENYNTVTVDVSISVSRATPIVTVVPVAATILYGQPLSAATLSGGTASVPGTFAFADPITVLYAGTNYQTVIFTPSDTENYNTVTVDVKVSVNRATPIVTEVPVAATILYGQPLSAATLSGGTASVPGTFAFASPTTVLYAGTNYQTAIFTPSDTENYNTVTVDVSVTVNPATPVITETPVAAAVTYGQLLAEAVLTGGTASVPGTFAFASPTTVPNAGTAYQTIVFTPTDNANYHPTTLQVSVVVNRATPVITKNPVAATILYGQPLSAATLSGGTASVPGTFAFASPTTIPSAGTANQTVIFTATDSANYHNVTLQVSVSVTVNRRRTDSTGAGESGTETFPSWISGFGGLGGLTALTDDPDGDGIANILEYALAGGDPDSNNCKILPVASVMTESNQKYLAITVRKNPAAVGITCLIEVSSDFVNWNTGSGNTVVVSETAETLIVRDSTPIDGSTRRFLRLKVTSEQP
jgi:hypothetical protein